MAGENDIEADFSATLRSAIRGDSSARSHLFSLVQPKIQMYLEQQSGLSLRRKIQVDDMCQDVFLRALRVLENLPETASTQDFINLVLKNAQWTILDAVKKNENFKGESNVPGGLVSIPIDPDVVGGEALVIEREESEWLHALIERLDEIYASVLWLKLDGLETAEIADRLSITPAVVRKRYQRAIEALRQIT
ncbi:MAG: hypothetical protein CBC13_06290 [Planctomycetia bacterium TMED53]|nr:MAG: hypothetical protein CBC13_06290 [Planctomycetia bacterium TMED53]